MIELALQTVQLNLHETDLSFLYLSHHLTWQCSSISEDLLEICSICSQNCFCYCFCGKIVQHFCIFTQICKKFAAFARKIVFVIVSEQFYYRNNDKNNFVSKCCKFLANLCKSSEILEQCHVK